MLGRGDGERNLGTAKWLTQPAMQNIFSLEVSLFASIDSATVL